MHRFYWASLGFISGAKMSLTLLLYSFLMCRLPCVWDYITTTFFQWAAECGPIFFFPFVLTTLCPMRWNLSPSGWHFELSWMLPNTWISACAAKTELLFSHVSLISLKTFPSALTTWQWVLARLPSVMLPNPQLTYPSSYHLGSWLL